MRAETLSVEELREVRLFSGLKGEQLDWILSRGEEVRLPAGATIARQGDPADGFYAILDGETEWTRRVGREEVHAVTLGPGEIFAELILLLGAPYPTTGRATTDVRLDEEAFWGMMDFCPAVRRGLLATATERAQIHEAVSQNGARLASLGTLAAGLAHELNNPASAAKRAARGAREALDDANRRALALGARGLSRGEAALVAGLPSEVAGLAADAPVLDAVERGDRGDEVALWLEDHGVEEAWDLSPVLVAHSLGTKWLGGLSERLPDGTLDDVLRWLAARLEAEALLREVEEGARRVSDLVEAVKQYAFMDEAPLQEVDVREGLESTLKVLGHKLDGVEVVRDYDPDLPRITAYGADLNGAWTALVDNALDAASGPGGGGHVRLRAVWEDGRVLVEVADDGPGIPDDVRDRIFDPFFTTKDVGSVGLGLDLARRAIARHGGELRFASRPGETRFVARLPTEPPEVR